MSNMVCLACGDSGLVTCNLPVTCLRSTDEVTLMAKFYPCPACGAHFASSTEVGVNVELSCGKVTIKVVKGLPYRVT